MIRAWWRWVAARWRGVRRTAARPLNRHVCVSGQMGWSGESDRQTHGTSQWDIHRSLSSTAGIHQSGSQ